MEIMTNIMIATLNHTALGFPSMSTWRQRFGPPLSSEQRLLVSVIIPSRLASMRRLSTMDESSASLLKQC